MPTLNNWSIVAHSGNPYLAPELHSCCLCGIVSDHPAFEDGARIQTSSIVAKNDEEIVTFSGSTYLLGTVDPDYESQFPGAYERLLDSL